MKDVQMNSDKLESEVISLSCFLVVSARELMNEPKIYGPMRLIEATKHLTGLAADLGVHNELLLDVSQRIDAFSLEALPEGEEEFVEFMDELIMLLATWVKDS
jgi:hypothetical protein